MDRTTGQIAWKSESKKKAGLQFVGLTAEARERIRSWIASGTTSNELYPETITTEPTPKTSATEANRAAKPAQTSPEASARQTACAETGLERIRNWIFSECRGDIAPQAIAPRPTSEAAEPLLAEPAAVRANSAQGSKRRPGFTTRPFASPAHKSPNRPFANSFGPRQSKEQRWPISSDVSIRPFEKTQAHQASAASLTPPQLHAQIFQPANLVPPSSSNAQPARPRIT